MQVAGRCSRAPRQLLGLDECQQRNPRPKGPSPEFDWFWDGAGADIVADGPGRDAEQSSEFPLSEVVGGFVLIHLASLVCAQLHVVARKRVKQPVLYFPSRRHAVQGQVMTN